MIKYLKEEAKRAKKAGLTKSQFIFCEILKATIIIFTYISYTLMFVDMLEKI